MNVRDPESCSVTSKMQTFLSVHPKGVWDIEERVTPHLIR